MAQPLLVHDEAPEFAAAVLAGLAQPQKIIPARFFYDRAGSELFEAITELPEYYPTRTEIGILGAHAGNIAAAVGPGRAVIEFGSGSSAKTPLLLRAIAPGAYVPVDISAEFLQHSAGALAADFPGLPVVPVAADFTQPFRVPASLAALPRLGFFPGSTLGNLAPGAAIDLLRSFAATLGPESWLVIGLDLAPGPAKSRAMLEAAYDDAQGVTSAFNLNLLHRINRELGGTIRTDDFAHRAIWNADLGRIEMHLVALRDTAFSAAGQDFMLDAGETIHTENSYKWTLAESRLMARASGWLPVLHWTDADARFAVHVWQRDAGAMQP
ncbi:MAG: L-histidine N(alpha)-methyltransferase [Sandarakinorhabdus sp.]|nr:L-histidine N(alpha)-methyltransferase [Sandarakinorhabdus sp.]